MTIFNRMSQLWGRIKPTAYPKSGRLWMDTIYDFVKAYEHFSDDDWDGEPEGAIEPIGLISPIGPISPEDGVREPEPCEKCGHIPCTCKKKVKIKLADGKERTIQHMMATTFWNPDGKPMSAAQFVERLFGDLPELFRDEDELRKLWSLPDTRRKLLTGLEEKGYGKEQLSEVRHMIDADQSDLFDVLAYIAFAISPESRTERVNNRIDRIFEQYANDKQRQFLSFVLEHYISQGVDELDQEKLPVLLELKYQSVGDAVAVWGSVAEPRDVFVGFQKYLYAPQNSYQ